MNKLWVSNISGIGAAITGVIMPVYIEFIEPYANYILAIGISLIISPWLLVFIDFLKNKKTNSLTTNESSITIQDNNPDLFPSLNETALKKHIAIASSHCKFEKDINHILLFDGLPFKYQLVVIGKDSKGFDGVKDFWDRDAQDLFEKHFIEVYREKPKIIFLHQKESFWHDWHVVVVKSLNEIQNNLILKKSKWVLY